MRHLLSVRPFLVLATLGLTTAAWADKPPPPFEPDAAIATIKPLPLVPIPDDPPPHEGAMIDIPYVIEPPDLVLVEVLEALPGRPISGERLVRPDGMISLGFYGELHVRGLTILQFKEKVVRHLRSWLPDEVLGLSEELAEEEAAAPMPADGNSPKIEPIPAPKVDQEEKSRPSARSDDSKGEAPLSRTGGRPVRRASQVFGSGNGREPLKAPPDEIKVNGTAKESPTPSTSVNVPSGSDIRITIEVTNKANPTPPAESVEPTVPYDPAKFVDIHPHHTSRVFVDVTAYNSKNFYVQGDVAAPGRLPCTGNETVLDAINYAGGLIPTGDPRVIHLIRPARAGKPARVYPVDLEAITERGEQKGNYQIFPGDRLVVTRNAVVKTTIEVDRLTGALQSIAAAMNQQRSIGRSVAQALDADSPFNAGLSQKAREALLKEWNEFLTNIVSQTQGKELDEKILRELLIRKLSEANESKPQSQPK